MVSIHANIRIHFRADNCPPCAETIEEFSVWEQFLWTWRLTGVTAECHTFFYLRKGLAAARVTTCYDAQHLPAGTRVIVAGLNIRPHRPPTKSGKPMLFTSVEDETDVLHVTCVGEAIDSCPATLLLAPAVLMEATIEWHGLTGQGASLLVERAKALNAARYLRPLHGTSLTPRSMDRKEVLF